MATSLVATNLVATSRTWSQRDGGLASCTLGVVSGSLISGLLAPPAATWPPPRTTCRRVGRGCLLTSSSAWVAPSSSGGAVSGSGRLARNGTTPRRPAHWRPGVAVSKTRTSKRTKKVLCVHADHEHYTFEISRFEVSRVSCTTVLHKTL